MNYNFSMELEKKILIILDKLEGINTLARKFLKTERWGGNVSLMILDAAITSTGVNYFRVVVPKVKDFEREFVKNDQTISLSKLANFNFERVSHIWKNFRSLQVSIEIARYLSTISQDDRQALREWAKKSVLTDWRNDPIGKIKGVGLVTYQYLRMMGGVDTVMPDKIVKRVFNNLLIKLGQKPVMNDFELITTIEKISKKTGRLQTEICLMTWFLEDPERIRLMP